MSKEFLEFIGRPEVLTASIGFGGALVGAFASVGGQLIVGSRTRKAEARSIAHSFLGEISGLLSIVKTRKYVENLRKATASKSVVGITARREYTTVYKQNAAKVGLIEPHLATSIVEFYTHLNSVLEDFETLLDYTQRAARDNDALLGTQLDENWLLWKTKLREDDFNIHLKVQHELASILEETGKQGDKICADIRRIY